MWRLWTRGWGPRSWWYWMGEATPRWIAFHLPRQVMLWAFIRVYANGVDAPGEEYRIAYDAWVRDAK